MNKIAIKNHISNIFSDSVGLHAAFIQPIFSHNKRFWSCTLLEDSHHPYVVIDTQPSINSLTIPPSIQSIYPSYLVFIKGTACKIFRVSNTNLIPEKPPIPWFNTGDLFIQSPDPRQDMLFKDHDPSVTRALMRTFENVHDLMRSRDGLQPPEALDELLGILFVLIEHDRHHLSPLWAYKVIKKDGQVSSEPASSHAQRVRGAQHAAIEYYRTMGNGIHGLKVSHLSDETLSKVVIELLAHHYSSYPIDLKSAALRAFLSNTLRRGLGIYLTPDAVVEAVVNILQPPFGSKVLDPACGSGSFLLHTLFHWKKKVVSETDEAKIEMWGIDLNTRVLRAAEVNLIPILGSGFHHWNGDTLQPFNTKESPPWFKSSEYDYIVTNPPFGVFVEKDVLISSSFGTAQNAKGSFKNRIGSEIVFIERCLDLLKPGGILAIVVPNSVINTSTYKTARVFIDTKGQLFGVLSLPSETFAITGTQSTTSVLFFQRRGQLTSPIIKPGNVFFAQIKNVGYDHTGRPRKGSNLPHVVKEFRSFLNKRFVPSSGIGRILTVRPGTEFSGVSVTASTQTIAHKGATIKLSDCATLIRTGRTPPRNVYTEKGYFILKVGNLTGAGIGWLPRDRNYVDKEYITKIQKSHMREGLLIKENDILLTSSAHSVKYIARKVDLIDEVPEFIQQPCTFVGEIMLIRPDPGKINPHYLLAYLRTDQARSSLQAMVRGQTAHLMPKDAQDLEIPVPPDGREPLLSKLEGLIQKEVKASIEAACRTRKISDIMNQLFSVG